VKINLDQPFPEFLEEHFPPRVGNGMRRIWKEEQSLGWPLLGQILRHKDPHRFLMRYRGFGEASYRAVKAKLKTLGIRL